MLMINIVQCSQEKLISLFFNPLSLIPLLFSLFYIYKWILTPTKNLPPSPPKLPIIGNLHQLGELPFRSLIPLSEKYGDIMLIHLGNKPTIVVSSAESAALVLKTHDSVLASRPPHLQVFRRLLYNGKEVASAPYGDYWRQMKSIFMCQLLSKKRVRSYRGVREEEVRKMIETIKGLKVVNMREVVMSANNDMTCRTAFGKKYREEGGDVDFPKLLGEFMKLLGGNYIGEYISWLRWTQKFNGVDADVERVVTTYDGFLERILQDHEERARKRCEGGDEKEVVKDLIDVLLEVQRDDTVESSFLDRTSIKGLILDLFTDSTETTTTAIDWTMSELIKNPKAMQTLRQELSTIACTDTILTESDLESTQYLKAVMKETLRLHAPFPLLAAHESMSDFKMRGYDISKGTQVLVNVWAISRSPEHWDEPENFKPERFLESSIDLKGHCFEFTPFGAGRRMCPGMGSSLAMMELMVANLVHWFDWSLASGADCESLDMTESPGISTPRKYPLLVVPSMRK